MNSIVKSGLLSFIWAGFILAGCASPPAPQKPSIGDLEPVPVFATDETKQWKTGGVCWVGTLEGPEMAWNLPIIPQQIREELKKAGYPVAEFTNQYYTRNERMAVKRQVFYKNFEMKQTQVKEGVCYDMKLVVAVNNYPDSAIVTDCTVWTRHLIETGQNADWDVLCPLFVANLFKSAQFRSALEVNE